MTRKSRRAKLVRTKASRVARVRPQPSVRQIVQSALRGQRVEHTDERTIVACDTRSAYPAERLTPAEVSDVLELLARVDGREDGDP